MNILIATLGGSWQVLPEILGFTNPEQLPLYRDSTFKPQLWRQREEHRIEPADEVWVVTTAEGAARNASALADWNARIPGLAVRLYWPKNMADIQSANDARLMAELIHRLVLKAHERAGEGQVLLSLAGGRKTMSADLQRAGQVLGCHALLHVIDLKDTRKLNLHPADFAGSLPEPASDAFLPLVVDSRQPGSEAVRLEWEKLKPLARISGEGAIPVETLGDAVLRELERIQRQADALQVNYRLQLSGEELQGNFRALYALPKERIEALRRTVVGQDPARENEDLAWLQSLPKAELHCHLGGILNPLEMVEVAAAEAERVAACDNPSLRRDLDELAQFIGCGDLEGIRTWLGEDGFKGLRRRWPVPEPLGICAFLLSFAGHEDLLSRLIYGDLLNPAHFYAVGIETYERLGDLQGSSLLQSKATLKAALAVLSRQCWDHHLRYLELRCSPLNYTRGGLSEEQVVAVLLEGIEAIGHCDIRLIFIASRHGDEAQVRGHVDLARRLLAADEAFARGFVGFDLAGAEHAGNPARFRELFRPLHERVVRLTIHAGEGEPVQNVWEAVYELSADRIGHGLTLEQDPALLERFRDRGIALEMCPSSNFQIVGFCDRLLGSGGSTYPMKTYLEKGLRVTVNTDDPGISLTDLSREYHKAAAMSPGGLSRWQILQLVRNSFRTAFCSQADRQGHLRAAEEIILNHCV